METELLSLSFTNRRWQKKGRFLCTRKTKIIKKKKKIQNQDTGCELKKICLNSKNEIIINDYT